MGAVTVQETTKPLSPQRWLQLELKAIDSQVGRWQSRRFEIAALHPAEPETAGALPLTLFRDERGDYRFNLSSGSPCLFITGTVTGSRVDSGFVADGLTLSQTVAAAYMDGERQVLSCPLPEALQAWVEAFIGRHGELLEARRKGKKGKGRAQDQLGVDTVDQASCGAVKATGPDGRERGSDSGNRAHE
ncbi:DUF3305 domain-containing protein [Aeromonas dhakensis]|uniref:DUF3305 domain-containing protein n=1 Tax=Aeromonas dhakensis TaxID=196024 RepID=UPI000378EEEE|nr:DUF3305 domain-containing protein [Aeromonas dhakensis]MBL0678856.1 DUF3305 domain-containing protein [Aeromonas dhakensis]TNI20086.1 hypothetical protein CF132_10835 [Aeromonas dhakensis]WDF93551.1 DUF3305 domain-containing protein [Aeromonas dhakensis]